MARKRTAVTFKDACSYFAKHRKLHRPSTSSSILTPAASHVSPPSPSPSDASIVSEPTPAPVRLFAPPFDSPDADVPDDTADDAQDSDSSDDCWYKAVMLLLRKNSVCRWHVCLGSYAYVRYMGYGGCVRLVVVLKDMMRNYVGLCITGALRIAGRCGKI